MRLFAAFAASALALALCASPSTSHAQSASEALKNLDTSTHSAYFELRISIYTPRGKKSRYVQAKPQTARLLFERPDRLRLVLRPGEKNEFRMVASAGVATWLDLATGNSGKVATAEAIDPLALALLENAGNLLNALGAKDLPPMRTSKLLGARFSPNVWGSTVHGGYLWLSPEGQPAGFEFRMSDGDRVHVSVLRFVPNPKTSPKDFQL